MPTPEQVAPCPCCGAWSLTREGDTAALLAVSDVLVTKALEALGKRIVREDRSRFRAMGSRPWHVAHTIWAPDDAMVSKALRDAWAVVPALLDAHGTCDATPRQVAGVLDSYVHDLAVTGTLHAIPELAYRFQSRLGIPVYYRERVPCGA